MGREQHPAARFRRKPEQGIAGRRDFTFKVVDGRASDDAAFEGGGKGRFVHDAAARRVDEDRAGLHGSEPRRVHKAARGVHERAVQGDDVADGEQFVEIDAPDAVLLREILGPEDVGGHDRCPEGRKAGASARPMPPSPTMPTVAPNSSQAPRSRMRSRACA